MKYPKEIDHEFTPEIVCPYCGQANGDSWEEQPGEEDLGLIECGRCEKSFYATRNISVSYSTDKADYGKCNRCGKNDVPVEDYHSSVGEYKSLCVKCGNIRKDELMMEYIANMQNDQQTHPRI